jgi:hypothetical protein
MLIALLYRLRYGPTPCTVSSRAYVRLRLAVPVAPKLGHRAAPPVKPVR